MDLKCPGSGESNRNLFSNIESLNPKDEVKFVIGDRRDYEWSCEIIDKYGLLSKCELLFLPVFRKIEPKILAEWLLKDKLYIRFQIQLHKYIWSPNMRGV